MNPTRSNSPHIGELPLGGAYAPACPSSRPWATPTNHGGIQHETLDLSLHAEMLAKGRPVESWRHAIGVPG